MDRWLGAVEKDRSSAPLPQKVVRDKPSDLGDECLDGAGNKLSDGLCPAGVVNVEGTPRTVAGDAITTDANKCQLKPLQPQPTTPASRSPTLSGRLSRRRSPRASATSRSLASTSSRRSRG